MILGKSKLKLKIYKHKFNHLKLNKHLIRNY